MKYTPENSTGKTLVDCFGTIIPGVLEWDDETEMATLLLIGESRYFAGDDESPRRLAVVVPKVADFSGCHPIGSFQSLKVSVRIPGAKIVDKENKKDS